MKDKIIRLEIGHSTVYHVQVSLVSEHGIYGKYSLRSKGFSQVMDTGLFDWNSVKSIKVLNKTKLTPLLGD